MNLFQGRRSVFAALILIVALGAFLRLYHISDWLHFELDQARDAKVIVLATEGGIGDLPLLGPRAGGTFLRLGPGFYYMEYVGALLFGNAPGGLAIPIALLSTASITLFYFFVRRFFETMLSLGLTLLFSVSTFMVMYGRFVWNPNPLPFFLIGGFYALLRAVDEHDSHRGRWLAASAFLLSFATHLHFLAFVSVPAIVFVFFLSKRPRFSWKVWIAAIAVALSLYIPMILNETITGGANSWEFLEAVQGKSNKSHHTITEQLVRDITGQAAGYWVMLTGYEGSSMGQFVSKGTFDFELVCDDDCHTRFPSAASAMLVFLLGAILMVFAWKKETDTAKKDFLLLSILWFGSCSALFLPLSFDFAPRFLLLVAPFPFLFLGLIVHFLGASFGSRYHFAPWIGVILVAACVASNAHFVSQRFDELRRASSESFDVLPDRILKEKTRVTLEQQYLVLDYMQAFQKENGYPVYMFSEPEHRRALKYLMERRGMLNDVLGYSGGIYTQGNYFLVLRTESNHANRLKKYMPVYDVAEEKTLGTLAVFRLTPKPEAVTAEMQVFEEKSGSSASAPGVPERYTWSEWWNHQSGTVDDETVDEGGE